MGPQDARDLMFAGAGILWGAVTVFRGIKVLHKQKASSSTSIAVGTALAISCLSYLVYRL